MTIKTGSPNKPDARLFGDPVQSIGGGWDSGALLTHKVLAAEAVAIEAGNIVAINGSKLEIVGDSDEAPIEAIELSIVKGIEADIVEAVEILFVEAGEPVVVNTDRVEIGTSKVGIIKVKDFVVPEANEHAFGGASEGATVKVKASVRVEAIDRIIFVGSGDLVKVRVSDAEFGGCKNPVKGVAIEAGFVEACGVERRAEDEHH